MKTEFKHTPGPWKLIQANPSLATIITEPQIPGINNSYYIISEVYAAGDIMDATANAKLISAAPDLLQCLDNCLQVKPHKVSVEAMKEMIRITIKKATES